MTKLEHTKEPWVVLKSGPARFESDAYIPIAAGSGIIAYVVDARAGLPPEWKEIAACNARLIAEAPTLKQQLAECQNDLTLEKSSCRALQKMLRTCEGERDGLREACELGLRHFKPNEEQRAILGKHPKMLEVYDKVCRAFEAALTPKPETSDGAVAGEAKA